MVTVLGHIETENLYALFLPLRRNRLAKRLTEMLIFQMRLQKRFSWTKSSILKLRIETLQKQLSNYKIEKTKASVSLADTLNIVKGCTNNIEHGRTCNERYNGICRQRGI